MVKNTPLSGEALCGLIFFRQLVKRLTKLGTPRRAHMRKSIKAVRIILASLLAATLPAHANTGVHTSWLWHLHQPIYWPDRAPANHSGDHYQNAWDTMDLQDHGFGHPSDAPMRTIFALADRIHAYQEGPKNTLQTIGAALNSGVQLNYSGALMENVQSLAQHGQYYGTDWYTHNQTAHIAHWAEAALLDRVADSSTVD